MTPDLIAIVGGGAWGTALANAVASAGRSVILWARSGREAEAMAATRENARFLPGIRIAEAVEVTAEAGRLASARLVLLVVPAQAVRQAAGVLKRQLKPGTPVVVCAKGIERDSGLFMTEVLSAVMPSAIPAVLSGPSFAEDVARGLPTAVVLAATAEATAARLARELASPALRIYHGTDVRGVEIGGAAKNVLAIACGIVVGRGLGESARAALVARGFAELARFARAHGARPETLMGLSGLGDLVLTCGSARSRNFAFGEALGRGLPIAEAAGGKLAEGLFTASALVTRARSLGIEMPVSEAVDAVLRGSLTIEAAIESLMNRPMKPEVWG